MRPSALVAALYSFALKGKKETPKPCGHSGLRGHGLNSKGAPEERQPQQRGAHRRRTAVVLTPKGAVLTKAERGPRCPAIIWTGAQLVPTMQVTGKQAIFTENAKKLRILEDCFHTPARNCFL